MEHLGGDWWRQVYIAPDGARRAVIFSERAAALVFGPAVARTWVPPPNPVMRVRAEGGPVLLTPADLGRA